MKKLFDQFVDSLIVHNQESQIAIRLHGENGKIEKIMEILKSEILLGLKDKLKERENEIWFYLLFPCQDINGLTLKLALAGAKDFKIISQKY